MSEHTDVPRRPCWVLHILGPSCCLRKCRVRDTMVVRADWLLYQVATHVRKCKLYTHSWFPADILPCYYCCRPSFPVYLRVLPKHEYILKDWLHIGCCAAVVHQLRMALSGRPQAQARVVPQTSDSDLTLPINITVILLIKSIDFPHSTRFWLWQEL